MEKMMSFSEYLEDVLDLAEGLMSEAALIEARKGFDAWGAPRKADPKHPDMKKTAGELKARCERLVNGQKNAIAKFAGMDGFDQAIVIARLSVAEGERLLAEKRATKAEYIAHAEMNSDASRAMNAVRAEN